MLKKQFYANGQKVFDLKSNSLTYYYKSGKIKAQGIYEHGLIQGEWKFYRENGQLSQIGHFLNGGKHGEWVRFDKNNTLEYAEIFINNKRVQK